LLDKSVDLRVAILLNIDSSVEAEMIVLADKLYVYSILDSSIIDEVNVFPLEVNSGSIDLNDIEIVDLDLDNHMDILIAHQFWFSRLRVSEELLDTRLPFVKEFNPKAEQQNIPTNIVIEIVFSEEIDINTLTGIEVKYESGTNLSFISSLSSSQKSLLLKPTSTWTANESITISLPSSITDLSGNSLDGNRNGVYDEGEEDYFIFSLNMGSGIDDIVPIFIDITSESEVYPGQVVSISGIATDENYGVEFNIIRIQYLLDNSMVFTDGIPVLVLDGELDSSEESFEIGINSTNLSFGNHTVFIATQDGSENWSLPDSINFSIVEKSLDNWNFHGNNAFNTSYAPSSTFDYPSTLKYTINNDIDNFDGLSRSIVIGDRVIYTSDSQLWVRNIETGNLIWKKTFDNTEELSTPCFAYGNLYLQVGDHSDSKLVSLSLFNGEILWSTPYSVQWSKNTSPVAEEGNILITEGYSSAIVSAYGAFNGNVKWKTEISNYSFDEWNPAVYDGKIYGYADNFSVIALETGVEIININQDELPSEWWGWSAIGSPVIDTTNNQVILTNKTFMFALDLDTYQMNWSINSNDLGYFNSTPALAGNSIYIGTDERIMEVIADNGNVVWFDDNYNGGLDPVVSDNIIAYSSLETLVIVNREDRNILGSYWFRGNLTLSGDYLIVSEYDGEELYVLEKNNSTSTSDLISNNVELYPSITSGNFILKSSAGFIGSSFVICDGNGVHGRHGIINSKEQHFEEPELINGLYYMSIDSGGTIRNQKFVIFK
jgi:hypothetical protein